MTQDYKKQNKKPPPKMKAKEKRKYDKIKPMNWFLLQLTPQTFERVKKEKEKKKLLKTSRYWRAHDVTQFFQVLITEVPVVSVASLYIFVDAMQVEGHIVQQLSLSHNNSNEQSKHFI